MHKIEIPDWAVAHVTAKRGKAHIFEDLDPRKTALLVVDMQKGFMMEAVAHNLIETAPEIVPNVNRIAAALRGAGGVVVWIKNTVCPDSLVSWSVFHQVMSTAEGRDRRIASMTTGALGHQLWPELEVQACDEIVEKTRFSAFIQGASGLEAMLRGRGVDTVIITGTVTNVCCESTARDAMMRNFKTLMISDANAARSDAEHNAALTAFYVTFGDVMSTDEVIHRIGGNATLKAATGRA